MLSLASLKPAIYSNFYFNSGRIIIFSATAALVTGLLACSFMGDLGNFLPLIPSAGYVLASAALLFIFDTIHYCLLHHKKLRDRQNVATHAQSRRAIEEARKTFLDSFKQIKSKREITAGGVLIALAEYKKHTKKVPRIKMRVHQHNFSQGFSFYYGVIEGQKKFIPISLDDHYILWEQFKNHHTPCWCIKNPHTDAYFVPEIPHEGFVIYRPKKRLQRTCDYINQLIDEALSSTPDCEARLILEALVPYAECIKYEEGGLKVYSRLKELIQDYPELPDLYPINNL